MDVWFINKMFNRWVVKNCGRSSDFFYLSFLFILIGGCSQPDQVNNSQVKIRIPTASEFHKTQSKTRAVSVPSVMDFDRLCFAVNFKDGNIPTQPSGACEVSKGFVVGSVAPGSELSLSLATNQNVSIEIYGFLRSTITDTCPTVGLDPWAWPLDKTYLLATKSGVAITGPETNVEFALSLPAVENSIVVQNSWPQSCLAPTTNEIASSGRTGTGAALLTGNQFKLYMKDSGTGGLNPLVGTHFQIKGWRPK